MINQNYLLLTIVMFFLISCDCNQYFNFKVLDSTTNAPIKGVKVWKISRPNSFEYTDANGSVELKYTSGGVFKCSGGEISFEKEGYDILVERFESGLQDTIKVKLSN